MQYHTHSIGNFKVSKFEDKADVPNNFLIIKEITYIRTYKNI